VYIIMLIACNITFTSSLFVATSSVHYISPTLQTDNSLTLRYMDTETMIGRDLNMCNFKI